MEKEIGEKNAQKIVLPEDEDGISVPNWLIESLEWIKREEMANSTLSISSSIFMKLCWRKLHGNVKPYCVKRLEFLEERNESGSLRAKAKLIKNGKFLIPIAEVEPPKYINGFERIDINFLDAQVMHFIECIFPRLNGIHLFFDEICLPRHCLENERGTFQVHRLLEMLVRKTFALKIPRLRDFMRFYPNSYANLMENVQTFRTHVNGWEMEVLIEWLAKPRADGQQKILRLLPSEVEYPVAAFIDRIKEQFIASTQSANFLVGGFRHRHANFVFENDKTDEVLELYRDSRIQCKFLVRHPKGAAQHFRPNWQQEGKEEEQSKMENVENTPSSMNVQIREIGEF